MKMIVAIIRPERLAAVVERLQAMDLHGMTISDVRGHGLQKGLTEVYRGTEIRVNFLPKIKLELVVPDGILERVIQEIVSTGRTGKIGDGKIFVLPVEEAVRVRTGERGEDAI